MRLLAWLIAAVLFFHTFCELRRKSYAALRCDRRRLKLTDDGSLSVKLRDEFGVMVMN